MGIWTVEREVRVEIRWSPQTGGAPMFGGVVLLARPDLDAREVQVEVDSANAEVMRWLPALREGFVDVEAERAAEGRPLGFLRLIIESVHWHERDTSDRAMRRVGQIALQEVLKRSKGGLELPDE